MVVDKYRHAAYHNKHWRRASWGCELRWPWTPQIWGFSEFFSISGWDTFQEWIAPKWLEIAQDNLHMKFSALNVDFSSSSPDPLRSTRPAHVDVKQAYPLNGYTFVIGLSSVKTLADWHWHAPCHNKHYNAVLLVLSTSMTWTLKRLDRAKGSYYKLSIDTMSECAAIWPQFSMQGFNLWVVVSQKRSPLSSDSLASCFVWYRLWKCIPQRKSRRRVLI